MRWIVITLLSSFSLCHAETYLGNPGNYTSFVSNLSPGDTLLLEAGDYTDLLNLRGLVGTETDPIVISGDTGGKTVFLGNACCNTVSLAKSAHLIIEHLTIDGQNIKYIDAIKAEGHAGDWTHDIEIRYLTIINHGADQQTNGISTKCPSWNWHVHHNKIYGAGTGMYFGNSNGAEPFVNGLIEYNLVVNTVGYNCQIKRQNDGSRDKVNIPDGNKTVVRYNVFSKAQNASSGGSARPNLLIGGLPETGHGASDYYEIYGNFFYQNPTEGLFQGTGTFAFYNNVLVNTIGGWGVAVLQHEGKQPRNVDIFHNTILVENRKSISFYKPDLAFTQRVVGNALFALNSVTGATLKENNIEEGYPMADNYLKNPFEDLLNLDCSPKADQLFGPVVDFTLFSKYNNIDLDFEGNTRAWIRRGAYTHDDDVRWILDLAIRPEVKPRPSKISDSTQEKQSVLVTRLVSNQLIFNAPKIGVEWTIISSQGKVVDAALSKYQGQNTTRISLPIGVYYFHLNGYQAEAFIVN